MEEYFELVNYNGLDNRFGRIDNNIRLLDTFMDLLFSVLLLR